MPQGIRLMTIVYYDAAAVIIVLPEIFLKHFSGAYSLCKGPCLSLVVVKQFKNKRKRKKYLGNLYLGLFFVIDALKTVLSKQADCGLILLRSDKVRDEEGFCA